MKHPEYRKIDDHSEVAGGDQKVKGKKREGEEKRRGKETIPAMRHNTPAIAG